MKPKKQNVKNVNKKRGLFPEDSECENCLYYKGKKRGCTLTACSCEDINISAKEKGKINRKRRH